MVNTHNWQMSSSNECCMITKDVSRPQSREIYNDIYTILLYVSISLHQTLKNKNHIKMIAQRWPKCVIVHQHQKEFCQSLKWTCWFRSANIAAAHCRLRVLLQAPAALAAQMRTAFRSSNAEREGAEKHSLPADPPGNICKRNRAPPEPTKCPIFGMNIWEEPE